MRKFGKNTGRDIKIENKDIGRGVLTTDVNKMAELMIGRKLIGTTELRLIPYVHYIMVNDRKLDINKINGEERKILQQWKKEGHIEGGASGLAITKHFWDFMCEVLFIAYVGYDNEEIYADTR